MILICWLLILCKAHPELNYHYINTLLSFSLKSAARWQFQLGQLDLQFLELIRVGFHIVQAKII